MKPTNHNAERETGVLIDLGLKANWPGLCAEAARLGKALEIYCYPDRQDLNVDILKVAPEPRTLISLGKDAHHPWQLEFIELGLAPALRARLPAQRIVNFMSMRDLKHWIQQLRDRSVRN
jgi:histidinol phosphatase-like PHP family hydrolase